MAVIAGRNPTTRPRYQQEFLPAPRFFQFSAKGASHESLGFEPQVTTAPHPPTPTARPITASGFNPRSQSPPIPSANGASHETPMPINVFNSGNCSASPLMQRAVGAQGVWLCLSWG